MRPHPAFSGREIPAETDLGPVRLERLCPAIVEEDFAAVTESADALAGLFGDDWPAGLTLEENRTDLAWHAKEFDLARSFAWVIRDGPGGRYLGCAYVFPGWGTDPPLDAYYWLRTGAEDRAETFAPAFRRWLIGPPWPQLPVTITGRPRP